MFFFTYIKESTLIAKNCTDTRAKIQNHEQNSYKNGPGTGNKSQSDFEPDPEPLGNL